MSNSMKKTGSTFAKKLIIQQEGLLTKNDYIEVSKPRFNFTINLCKELVPDIYANVLDVGRSYQSFMLAEYYKNVTTLGFPLGNNCYGHEYSNDATIETFSKHIVCDLNNAQHEDYIRVGKKFNLIVFSEVIEHLFTAPELVLHLLKSILSDDGLIVCLTPNAAALHKRLSLLKGNNPYEKIRFDNYNPGHFREYTKDEMINIGEVAGLEVVEHMYSNFSLRAGKWLSKLAIYHFISGFYQQFMTHQIVIYRSVK